MLILPNTLLVVFGNLQNRINVGGIFANELLNVLRDNQSTLHLLQRLIWPTAEVLYIKCFRNESFYSLNKAFMHEHDWKSIVRAKVQPGKLAQETDWSYFKAKVG